MHGLSASAVRRQAAGSHPLEEAGRVLADVGETADDVVQVEVAERGVVLALPPHL